MKNNNVYKRSCNYNKTSKTLDYCHKTNIDFFRFTKESLQTKYDELEKYKNQLEKINNIPNSDKSDIDFKNLVVLKDKIDDINRTIKEIESNTKEIEYYSNTADILYNYYNLVENNSDNNLNISQHLNNSNSNKKSILEYFHIPSKSTSSNDNMNIVVIDNTSKGDINRASLLDEYLSITDKNYINDNIDNTQALRCDFCNSMDKTIISSDSISICNNCNSVQHMLTDNEKPSYKDPPKEISYFSYKRINHYQEWLNQIQGKETTDIPEEVFDKIMLELKKQRITNKNEITRSKIKEILKKLKINKYYEHIPYILNRITGIPNPNLTPELEEKLRNMFKEIQVPFLKHSPLVRKNFLSYSYVIHKFIQLLGKDEYLKYFPLLKSREKLHQQEEIWKKICNDLNWKFIRSI